ncbi:MAG: hypothetical protein AAFN93_03320 [Bacteroidota bacterium]
MKLLFDFGLVVLIWIVQLIIYPSFAYYADKDLLIWHQKYTLLITVIVLPLMLGQLILHGYAVYQNAELLSVTLLILVVSTWVITFIWAVPLHTQIDQGVDLPKVVKNLVTVNWSRTIIWTLVFVIGLIHAIKNSTISY